MATQGLASPDTRSAIGVRSARPAADRSRPPRLTQSRNEHCRVEGGRLDSTCSFLGRPAEDQSPQTREERITWPTRNQCASC